jgi:hypothetical protein
MFLLINSSNSSVNQVNNFPMVFNVTYLIARLVISGLVVEAAFLRWSSFHHKPISLFSIDAGIILISETFNIIIIRL